VTLNGAVCTMRHKKIRPGDRVELAGNTVNVEAE
jgi:ribosome-associated protein YbcJ (S4-like RNA binding protein)